MLRLILLCIQNTIFGCILIANMKLSQVNRSLFSHVFQIAFTYKNKYYERFSEYCFDVHHTANMKNGIICSFANYQILLLFT